MLGVGWTEMLVIGVVALIVIGPKELPALMQKMGKFVGTIRRMGADFQREINKTTGLDEIKSLRTSITAPLKATTDAIRKEFNTTTSTGNVQPSGALKPADPKVESVVDEIHAAAGMTAPKPVQTPQEAMKDAMKQAMQNGVAARKEAAAKAAAVTTAAAVPAATKATPKKAVARKKVESPAPIEAIAPLKQAKPAAKKAPAKAPVKAAVKAPVKAAIVKAAPAKAPTKAAATPAPKRKAAAAAAAKKA